VANGIPALGDLERVTRGSGAPDPGAGRRISVSVRWLTILVTSLAVAAVIPLDLLPWLRGPAPYPPEWQWGYRANGPARSLWTAVLLAAAVLALLAATGTRWARRRPRAAAALLTAAIAVGWGLQLAALERDPAGPLRALMARALSPSISSYLTVAVEEGRDPRALLETHATRLPALLATAKHAATHPPGPILFYRAAIGLCERSPALTDALLRAADVRRRESQTAERRAARAGGLLGALALGLLGVLTLWPLALLAETLGLDTLAAARVGLLWTLVPGLVVMSPALDAATALPVTASALLLARATRADSRRSLVSGAVVAGVCGAIALFTSYGSAAFLGIAGGAVVAWASGDARTRSRAFAASALVAAVTATIALGLPAALGHQPLLAMRTALGLHRAAFTLPRSYALWLVFDPLDLAIFTGLPIVVAGLWAMRRTIRRLFAAGSLPALDRFRLGVFVGIVALVLAGVVRGEVGRILIPLMPFVLVSSVAEGGSSPDVDEALGLGALLAVLTLAIDAYWVV
jgi:hypothetical protein